MMKAGRQAGRQEGRHTDGSVLEKKFSRYPHMVSEVRDLNRTYMYEQCPGLWFCMALYIRPDHQPRCIIMVDKGVRAG
jgi:hypothetical protein